MRVAVAGGTGRIGARVVRRLRDAGHCAVPLSRSTGVNTLTRDGLPEALAGATVVVDATNSPSTDQSAARWFFETSTFNLLAAENVAGVRHHVVVSFVGVDRIDAGHFHAKRAQEASVRRSDIPYSIVRGTHTFQSLDDIFDASSHDGLVRLAPVPVQPTLAEDFAAFIVQVTSATALNGTVEVAGPERFPLDELARTVLAARRDEREIVSAPYVRYLGAELTQKDKSLLPNLTLTSTRLRDWLHTSLTDATGRV